MDSFLIYLSINLGVYLFIGFFVDFFLINLLIYNLFEINELS